MNASTGLLNQTCRCYWTTFRKYNDRYQTNTRRAFSSITSSFVYHHRDSSCARAVNLEQEPSVWDARSAVVYPNIISEIEEKKLVSILTSKFQRRRYEQGHWDAVIKNYREIELFDEETDDLKLLLQPIRNLIEDRHSRTDPNVAASLHFSGTWLPCHAIDLHQDGELNAHVDSVRFSGNLVAGLSLLSDAIMRLKPSTDSTSIDKSDEKGEKKASHTPIESNEYVDLLLPRRSLYVLSGMSRYGYSHELLPSGSLFQNKTAIHRDRRLSVIFRDTKQ